jgi:hypothetical protein
MGRAWVEGFQALPARATVFAVLGDAIWGPDFGSPRPPGAGRGCNRDRESFCAHTRARRLEVDSYLHFVISISRDFLLNRA